MCGIAGIVYKKKKAETDDIVKMTRAIAHRGPDAEGFWTENHVALGHRRLSIIDMSKESNQPMVSSGGRYVITFNGEIYNYIELKQELILKGVSFSTAGDTEVILEAYKFYGYDCVRKFNGMWSFCIYDKEKQILFISRDRFGIKPLYIIENENMFAFGSEAKAITAAFPGENIPDLNSVYRFLTGRNTDIDSSCFYKNIKIFPSASYMIYDLNTGSRQFETYWQVNERMFYDTWVAGKNPVKTFRALFEDAVKLRLRADVEVGACLSGGVDSSAIVGCCTKKFNKRMHTFSSIYKDKDCNEEEYIQEVNRFCNAVPHYVHPDLEAGRLNAHMKKIIHHFDGPITGASLFSQYMVMKEIQGNVKVVLDGQGADELFGGYIPYYSFYISGLAAQGGWLGRIRAVKLLTIVKHQWPELFYTMSEDVIAELVGVKNFSLFVTGSGVAGVKAMSSCSLFTNEFLEQVDDRIQWKLVKCSTKLKSRLCNDVICASIPALLHNEDSNSMAFSIESRTPFLDYRLVEFSIALNDRYKIKNCWTKWIVRKGCRKYMPSKIIKRKNKMGFPAPFSKWLREGESSEEIRNIIFSLGERNIVPSETIKNYYKAHMSGEVDMSGALFRFYSLELWLRTCNPGSIGL